MRYDSISMLVQNYPLKINLHSGSFLTFQPGFAADPGLRDVKWH